MKVLYSPDHNLWKVTDFGISTESTSGKAHTTRYARGSTSYRAPELIQEHPTYTNKVDIWALGCVLYELTTYKIAFPESWNIRDYSLSEVPISVQGPLLPQLPRFCQHHVVQNIHDLLQSKSDCRPRAADLRQIYILYRQILNVQIADTLLNAEKHPSYMQCKDISQNSRSDLEMMFLLANTFDTNDEHAIGTTLRRYLIDDCRLEQRKQVEYTAEIETLRIQNMELSEEKARIVSEFQQKHAAYTTEIELLRAKNMRLTHEKARIDFECQRKQGILSLFKKQILI